MFKRTFVALVATIAVVVGSGLVVPTAAVAAGDEAALQHSKSVVGSVTQFKPGDRFDYEIEVGCSSTTAPGCLDAFVLDSLPKPLQLDPDVANPIVVSLAPTGTAVITRSIAADGQDTFRVTPKQSFLGGTGLAGGGSMLVTVSVIVPTTTSGVFNGATVTNTSVADASNASEVAASADITLAVTTTLAPKISKTVSPGATVPALPGRAVDWTIKPGNGSNQNVDTIVMQDPANPPLASLGYLDIQSVDITDPAGTTGKLVEYFVGGAWTSVAPTPLADADGVRVTFTGTFAPGVSGEVSVHSKTNATVSSIPRGTSVTVANDATTVVRNSGVESAVVTGHASVVIANRDPDVAITKSFVNGTLVSGQSTMANVVATIGSQNVKTLTVVEPSAGQPGFTAQGLVFTGFGPELAWPVAATSAEITYNYSGGCADSTATSTTVDTLGAPTPGCTVEGFTVRYMAAGDDLQARAYATLPLKVTALPVTTPVVLSSTNFVDTTVENVEGASGIADANASFTVAPLEVGTEVSKTIAPSEIFGAAGTDAKISLTGKVADDSTVGSKSLIISDPADPAGDSAFWDALAPTSIENTDIPACAALTLRYWSKTDKKWTNFPTATAVPGPVAKWGFEIPKNLRADIGGIQYEFVPTCAALLPAGFVVHSYINIKVKTAVSTQVTLDNVARSVVHNPDALVPTVTDDAQDDLTLIPTNGGTGPSYDLIGKEWLIDSVAALSKDMRTARLSWSTQGLNLSQMQISDPGSEGERTNVATSVYDAFNLVAISPIRPATDPLIVNDKITKVELYTGDAANPWLNITTSACMLGCEGTFGGYTLTPEQQELAQGVRITFSERTEGAGVGSSYDRRPMDLVFQVRDTLRSRPGTPATFVLGSHHAYTYNTGSPGVVNNTVNARGENTASGLVASSGDADLITIIDSPINVSMTKTFDQEQLGLPAASTSQSGYPLISSTLTATNESATRIATMHISDPSPAQAQPTAFEVLNLYTIDTITPPSGLTSSDARIILQRQDGTTDRYTPDAAKALTPTQLADIVGVSVFFAQAGGMPVIPAAATGTLGVTWQLRATNRSDATPVLTTAPGKTILNVASAELDSPGRIICPADGCSQGTATAQDDFAIVAANYTISAWKSINPTSVAENGSKAYSSTLSVQPNGSARTTSLTVTDFAPTFWNTMNFVSASITVPRPVNQVRMDVLIDNDDTRNVEYAMVAGSYVATCNGDPIVDGSPCVLEGAWMKVTGATVSFGLPPGVSSNDQIVGVRFTAERVVDGVVQQWERPYNPRLDYTLKTERRDTLRSDPAVLVSTTRPGVLPNPGETLPGVISNSLVAVGAAQFGPNHVFNDRQQVDASTKVVHQTNSIKVTKTRGSTATINPAGAINYVMTVENTGQWDMTGFALTDQVTLVDGVSPLVEPLPRGYTFAITGNGAPSGAAGFSASLNTATGELSIVNSNPAFVFRSGWKLTISAPLRFREGLSPDETVTNSITASADRKFERCESTKTDLVANPVQTDVVNCSAATSLVPRASATVAMKKWVKGNLAGDPATTADDLGVLNVKGLGADCDPSIPNLTSDGFYSYPCAPITRPGGEASWRLDFFNTGNTNAKVVAAVDVLPDVGDKGVIVGAARGSQFAVTLLGQAITNVGSLADGQHATVRGYYSNKVLSASCNTNAVQVHTANAAPNGGCAFGWTEFTTTTPESQLAGAKTVKFVTEFANPDAVTPGPGLRPGETLSITFNTRTPFLLPAEGADPEGTPVAYNSFAGSSRTVATATQGERAELVLEPERVGIATATGQLNLVKIVDAPAFASSVQLPTSYEFLVTCVSGGQTVTLLNAAGANASRPRVPADGSAYLYNRTTGPVNLPMFADCNITEPTPPAGVTVETPTVAVTAERDLSEDPAVWRPYVGDTASARLELTNEYHVGEFSVLKSVDAGGAVDQDGTAIAYDYEFDFTVSCTYLGQEVVPAGDRSFSLADGANKDFTDIPTGATCTVTETDPGLAGSTNVTITRNGLPVSGTGTTVTFTVGDENTVLTDAFENVMTVGSLEVEKIVTGAGAADFGQGPFTMHVLCTLDDAAPNTVYDGDLILGGAEPLSKQIDNLPTGAECTVTETDAAGAQHVAVTPTPAIIGVANVVTVTVTNTFTIGSLEIEKRIEGAGAALYGAGPFEITITCVLNGVPVTVPGGATRALTDANGYMALYDTLPVGAVCGIEETDKGGASTVAITDDAANPISEVTITDAVAPTQVIVTNTFELGSIEVSKFVWGDPNGDHQKRVFGIELTCEWAGNPLAIPGGASRDLTVADGVVYADLPIGADCSLVETDNGGAVMTTMTPADPTDASKARVVVTAGAATSIVVDNTYEIGLPLTGGERAMWLLPFGGVLLLFGAVLIVVRRVRQTRSTL